MAGEQVFRLLVGLFVGVGIARHLGPGDFGQLNYALSFASLFGILATLGLNRILVRELVIHSSSRKDTVRLMSTALALRLAAATITFVICIASAWLLKEQSLALVALIAGGFFFSASDCIELYFQSKTQARRTASARLISFFIVTLIRIVLLLTNAPIEAFAAVTLLEFVGAATALQIAYKRSNIAFARNLIDLDLALSLLKESWPEILAGFSCLLFMRLDQIMLEHMVGSNEVGKFAVAVRLSEIWYFIPSAIIASTFPNIVAQRSVNTTTYMNRIQILMTSLAGLSYLAIAFTIILATPVVRILYGDAYLESASILVIHIWCGIFVTLGLSSGSWLMAEKKVKLNLYRNTIGAIANIVLNLFLIPRFGAKGAAYATLASFIIAYFLFDLFAPSMKEICKMKWRAIFILPGLQINRNIAFSFIKKK